MGNNPYGYNPSPFGQSSFSGLGQNGRRIDYANQNRNMNSAQAEAKFDQQRANQQRQRDELLISGPQKMLIVQSEIPAIKSPVKSGSYVGLSVSGKVAGIGVIIISSPEKNGGFHTELSIKNSTAGIAGLQLIFRKLLGKHYKAKFATSTEKVHVYRIIPVT